MRIVEISVEKLFGIFDHTIRLNQEDRITIIHSPNGFGKTAILRLIHAIFSGSHSEISSIPYKIIKVVFDTNVTLLFEKDDLDPIIIYWSFFNGDKSSEKVRLEWVSPLTDITSSIKTVFVSIERIRFEKTHQLRYEIEEKTKDYSTLTQSLESTYPLRLVEKKEVFDIENLKNKLRNIENRQKDLVSAGLFDAQNIPNPSFIDKVDDSTQMALSLYVEDMEKKFAIFDEIEEKVEILKEIINSRFLYKKMLVSKNEGIYFVNDTGEKLSFGELSSGEQHELVLFYELLFETKENSLILIDEPEISLHVEWQSKFLKDLARAAKNSMFDVLLATHSPQIIADRWDLTVELKGKKNSANFNGNGSRNLEKVEN